MNFRNPDFIIIGIYFAALLFIGLWSGRKKKEHSAKDFFLTSKTLPWYAIGLAIIAAGISSEQFLGAVGYAYDFGLPVANWEWLNGPSIIILVFFFVAFYIRKNIITMPQFLEMRYNGKVRTLFAIITILIYVFINLAGVMYSGGIAIKGIFGFDNIFVGIWVLTIIGGIFVVYGGMESVAWTNVFQSVLLLGGGLLVFFIGIFKVPGGWETIIGEGERSHLILSASNEEIPWTALLVLALSTNVWFFGTNQCINQSVLGAKNEWHAKMGVLLAGFLGIIIAFADVFPGLIAHALNLNISDAQGKTDEAYIHVVSHLVPLGLRGLVFAGLCGAIISTIEALTNACSTIFTFDIFNRVLKTKSSEKKQIKAGRLTGIIVLIVAAAWAPMVGKFEHIFQYFQQCWAFVAIPTTVVFIFGILWKKMSNTSSFWTLMLTFPMFLMPWVANILDLGINTYALAGLCIPVVILFAYVITLLSSKDVNEDVNNYIWNPSMSKLPKDIFKKGDYPWYKRIGLWAAVMIGLYVTIYIILW